LRALCRAHPEILYALLLTLSATALREVIATKTKGARIGFTSVLHTWGRKMQHHPHIHIIVPAAAYHPDHDAIILPKKDDFLVHYQPLACRFRNLLKTALQEDHPELFQSLSPKARAVFAPTKQWNVNLRHVGQGRTALRYLARYVQRSAFSPKRLLGYDAQGRIRLRWTCSTTGKTSVLPLTPHEFI
jgi:hypothetical protein